MSESDNFSPAWLAYNPLPEGDVKKAWEARLTSITAPKFPRGTCTDTALRELRMGIERLLGAAPGSRRGIASRRGAASAGSGLEFRLEPSDGSNRHPAGSFSIESSANGFIIKASDEEGLLYASFRLLSLLAQGAKPDGLVLSESPRSELRMLDHWDNLDGSIERGYSGSSIFFRDGEVLAPGPRLLAYARLCASIGINAACLNNVNVRDAETRLITRPQLRRLGRVASVFRSYGIKLFLSANFASPITLGDLDTADPLDPRVRDWWGKRAELVWKAIPDFGGFVVKADSEHRPGPFTYGRDHADGANMLAAAVAPFGGTILWRCFVYNCMQDWRDRKTDRARAAYDHFNGLDGRLLPNVRLQIKNGPMDFQPREPVSPLFGSMPATAKALELQATQEYTGQQRHLCYLPEQWKSYLDFPIAAGPEGRLSRQARDMVAVANVGDDYDWTGHDLAQANWYGFGRLAWDPDLDALGIAREWARLSFGPSSKAVEPIVALLHGSWESYESYTAPLGVGWMVNPSHHYGPSPDGYEYDRWGTYHFADRDGVGVDRSAATGTGYASQYRSELAAAFERPELCPEELLLFFHHVPYGYKLKRGESLIQHIYDSHFEGANATVAMLEAWRKLEGELEPELYARVLSRFEEQQGQAALWRDVINTYFFRKSGISDEKGRLIYR